MNLKTAGVVVGVFLYCCWGSSRMHGDDAFTQSSSHREVAVTFDDLPGVQMPTDKCNVDAFRRMNKTLLKKISKNNIPAIGFVVETRLCDQKIEALDDLLTLWLDAHLMLGNHSASHLDLNKTPKEIYEDDILRGEQAPKALLLRRGQELKYFRYPYLHAGNDIDTKVNVEQFLARHGYRIAPVTIDNQEWMFAEVYARALRGHDSAAARHIGAAYITYMSTMFEFFENLSRDLVGYEIKQILLLHDNQLNADYLDQLLKMIRNRGYKFISLDQALQDSAYQLPDTYVGPDGISSLHRWAISKGWKMRQEPREPEWVAVPSGLSLHLSPHPAFPCPAFTFRPAGLGR